MEVEMGDDLIAAGCHSDLSFHAGSFTLIPLIFNQVLRE
jgi:hypothetical protein